MSELLVPITTITSIRPHPNANKLELADIEGYQCCVPLGQYQANDIVIYVPPGLVVPRDLSDKAGITSYLSKTGRVKSIRLRGEYSHGLVLSRDLVPTAKVGENVAEILGITKAPEPEEKYVTLGRGGRRCQMDPRFINYTDIENLRRYTKYDILVEGEEVIVTEKVDGTRCGLAMINGVLMARSKNIQRVMPQLPKKWYDWILEFIGRPRDRFDYNTASNDWYWYPWCLDSIQEFFRHMSNANMDVIMYGETYGPVQRLQYGAKHLKFAAYDILTKYRREKEWSWASYHQLKDWSKTFGFSMVPILYQGPYSYTKIQELASGKTTIGGDHIRDGVVVRPSTERIHPKLGRVIFKYVSDGYLAGDYED